MWQFRNVARLMRYLQKCALQTVQRKCGCALETERKDKNCPYYVQVDADDGIQLIELINSHKPELVMNIALSGSVIMDACLACGVNCGYSKL